MGHRVAVRRRVPGGLTDAVGHLISLSGTALAVLRKDGRVTEISLADVVAAKTVPAEPVRPGWQVPAISPEDMQRICSAGWPARETAALGSWQLRAHAGLTGRANSAMAVGDPGVALAEASQRVHAWYAERGLPPLVQLPLADPAGRELAELGWARQHVTIVQVAPVDALLSSLPPLSSLPDLKATVADTPDAEWRALMHDLSEQDPDGHVAILTGPPVVGFVTVHRAGAPVGIGRVSVEGTWAGITSVDVDPSARRLGIGTAVMRVLVEWAASRGATATYLQVRAGNDAALRLYAALGYRTHHPYQYLAAG